MRLSFVIPTRNNLKYLKCAIESIQEHYGDSHDIILLDDASDDGTWEWIVELGAKHSNVLTYRHEGPERIGHILLYNKGTEMARTEAVTFFHSDMIITPNFVANVLKHLTPGTVVSSTRIEPPLHPPGPEKIVRMFGFEPEEFDRKSFEEEVDGLENSAENKDQTTNGMFVPWTIYTEDFLSIGGFDSLFAPMELDDSDLANRLFLNGISLIQARDSFVYHMTCRGSRFKDGIEIEAEIPLPDGTIWYKPKDSEEYKAVRRVKFREWWRKWGCNVLHNELLMPIVPPKYDIGFKIHNCSVQALEALEPWCSQISINTDYSSYLEQEQKISRFNLAKRFKSWDSPLENDIVVEFDANRVTQQSYQLIQQLSQIIAESGEVGEFELDIFKIKIKAVNTYENKLITNSDQYYTNQLL